VFLQYAASKVIKNKEITYLAYHQALFVHNIY